jgi:hypothetical protein
MKEAGGFPRVDRFAARKGLEGGESLTGLPA